MPYCFRLTLAAKQDSKFMFDAQRKPFELGEDLKFALVARDADTLAKATKFHVEGTGFADEPAARNAGERVRVRLRLLNALLGLGLNVPTGDSQSGGVSEQLKRKVHEEQGAVVLDNVWGLITFPDDGRHFEYVLSGRLQVYPSDPAYIFTALKTLWSLEVRLDQSSEVALQILSLATLETSDKAAFLTTYLALEQLVERNQRGPIACELFTRFQVHIERASKRKRNPLPNAQAKSLSGALAALTEESFSQALMRLADSIAKPSEIKGLPLKKFLAACVEARNAIAHNANPRSKLPLSNLVVGLRRFVFGLIWLRNGLESFTVTTPSDAITVPAGGLSMRVL